MRWFRSCCFGEILQSKLKRAIRTLDKHLATLRKDLSGIADRRETLGV